MHINMPNIHILDKKNKGNIFKIEVMMVKLNPDGRFREL